MWSSDFSLPSVAHNLTHTQYTRTFSRRTCTHKQPNKKSNYMAHLVVSPLYIVSSNNRTINLFGSFVNKSMCSASNHFSWYTHYMLLLAVEFTGIVVLTDFVRARQPATRRLQQPTKKNAIKIHRIFTPARKLFTTDKGTTPRIKEKHDDTRESNLLHWLKIDKKLIRRHSWRFGFDRHTNVRV